MLEPERSKSVEDSQVHIALIVAATALIIGSAFSVWPTEQLQFEKVDLESSGIRIPSTRSDTNIGTESFLNLIFKKNDEASIVFVGDIMLSRTIGNIMLKKDDWTHPFLKSFEFTKDADIAVGNLEGPISDRGYDVGSIYSFRADPRSVKGLVFAGFDVLSLANNHIFDYGPQAMSNTLEILQNNGIEYIGAGKDFIDAHQPAVKEVNGNKIAFLAYSDLLPKAFGRADSVPAAALIDSGKIISDIINAKAIADIIVVIFHWGEEYEIEHNSSQEDLAHMFVDAGADIIVGHHAHVVQEIEQYNDGYIAYSLGNFVFDQNFSPDTRKGLAIRVTIKNRLVVKVESYNIEFNSTYQPYIVEAGTVFTNQ